MSESYDILVLGGGIVGTAIAWQLTELEPTLRVGLVEKSHIGAGSTSRSAAAFRHQFSAVGNVALSRMSYEVYSKFNQIFTQELDPGTPKCFRENGYLFLYTKPELFEIAQGRARIQQELGVPVQVLDAAGVDAQPSLKGFFNLEPVVGATWCTRDGFLDPLLAAQTFFKAAQRNKVQLIQAAVTGLLREKGRVIGVKTGATELRAGQVINAMGFAANRVFSKEKLKLPFIPVKRYLYVTSEVRGVTVTGLPLVVVDLEPYMRPEAGNALLMGWDALPRVPSEEAMGESFDFDALEAEQDRIDPEFTNDEYGLEVRARLADVVPILESDRLKLFQETCGYYQITADEKPILDRDSRAPGLIHAIGFSGHGVMHAPGAARIIAGIALGRPAPEGFPLEAFALEPLLAHQPRPDPEHMSI